MAKGKNCGCGDKPIAGGPKQRPIGKPRSGGGGIGPGTGGVGIISGGVIQIVRQACGNNRPISNQALIAMFPEGSGTRNYLERLPGGWYVADYNVYSRTACLASGGKFFGVTAPTP